jgi:1,4-alpha-glucan branching enzyme
VFDRLYAVTFVYPEATAGPVHLLGSFNDWDPIGHPLRRVDGVWQTTVYLPAGVYPFAFVAGVRPGPQQTASGEVGERYSQIVVPDDLPRLRAA